MNKVTARIEFSFKGEEHKPSVILDLDEMMQKHHGIPPLHQYLATLHNIDSYSYEYEMLLAEEVQFSDAEGFAESFVTNNHFDQTAFEQYWLEQEVLKKLAPTIKQQLDIEDINQHPALKSVILSAYKMGSNG
ncbi:MAG: hypothetical protein PSN44_03430 [Gammaproteobacteria bacterium]|nr:hypothetical protein [Gammaproteobacteria bacterium]